MFQMKCTNVRKHCTLDCRINERMVLMDAFEMDLSATISKTCSTNCLREFWIPNAKKNTHKNSIILIRRIEIWNSNSLLLPAFFTIHSATDGASSSLYNSFPIHASKLFFLPAENQEIKCVVVLDLIWLIVIYQWMLPFSKMEQSSCEKWQTYVDGEKMWFGFVTFWQCSWE